MVEITHRHEKALYRHHHGGDGAGPGGQVEQGEKPHRGGQMGKHQEQHSQAAAGQSGQGIQGQAHLIHLVGAARADLPADEDGGRTRDPDGEHQTQLLHISCDGVGGQDLCTPRHVSHDGGEDRGAKAPQGLIAHHRTAARHELPGHLPPGAQEQPEVKAEGPGTDDMDQDDGKLHHPGDQGGQRRAGHPQGRGPQLAENEHPVQKGVDPHGDRQNVHPQPGALHAPPCGKVHQGHPIEHIGQPDEPPVLRRQSHHLRLVAEQAQEGDGEQEEHQGKGDRDQVHRPQSHSDHPVDGLPVPFPPVLADEDGGAALYAEEKQLHHKNWDIGQGHSGHRGLPQHPHHEGIRHGQGAGDEVL